MASTREPSAARRYAAWLADFEDTPGAAPGPAPTPPGSDLVYFAGGLPDPDLFPVEPLADAYAGAIRERSAVALQYGPPMGALPLRELIAERLAGRGIHVGPNEVLVTSGSFQGLNVVGRVLLDDGDLIAVEAPTFMGAFGAWTTHRPRYVTVTVDSEGMEVDALEESLRQSEDRPRFVYVLPTFQNPSGVTLNLERRQRLLEIAERYDLLLVEDDPYGELWFDAGAPPPPPIRALPGAERRVIYLGSFSKILAPGIRLGFAVAEPAVLRRLTKAKFGSDMHTDNVTQYAVVRLCRSRDFDLEAHVDAMRAAYRERRDAMLDALEARFPSDARWTRPTGGFFIWCDLPGDVSAQTLLGAARAEGVNFVPGDDFYPGGAGGRSSIRLSYSNVSPRRIEQGVDRLARALQRVR